jgi:hypothetical protein
MDVNKVGALLSALDSTLGALEKAVELRAQTQRFRNAVTTNDFDRATNLCAASIRAINEALENELANG